jgi:hypothetical protein
MLVTMSDDFADIAREAWALRTFGAAFPLAIEYGDDRSSGVGLRCFYGPDAERQAGADIRRGEGPRCESCGRRESPARALFVGPHPYHSEINHDDSETTLCGDCYTDASEEI